MRITNIRHLGNGGNLKTKLTSYGLDCLAHDLHTVLSSAGYTTEVKVTGSSIVLSLGMRLFRVNTVTLGHNAKIGWDKVRRTDLPTFEQRVDFNRLVVNTLRIRHYSATVSTSAGLVLRGIHATVTCGLADPGDVVPLSESGYEPKQTKEYQRLSAEGF